MNSPPNDAVFQHLMTEALTGGIHVYGIVVSTARLVPFDPTHQPHLIGEGPKIVAALLERWRAGLPPQPWVYPRGGLFVVSDDYVKLGAIRAAKVETIACQCLGEPKSDNVVSVTGPLPTEWVRKAFGL